MTEMIEFYVAGSIAIIGIIEWLKQLNIKNFHKLAPYISLVLCISSGLFAAKSFNRLDAWTIFCCCGGLLATVQLGYQAIVESICRAINKYLNKNKYEKTIVEDKE